MSMTKRVVTMTVGLMLVAAVSASAQPIRRVVVVPRIHAYRPFVYDPYWGPWYPYGWAYSYPYYGAGADIRTDVNRKDAEVYVDGYYAGEVNQFDGAFKHLHVVPGGHTITFHLDGFRTVTENVYVRPDSTLKMKATMERLPVGEASAPVPAPRRAPDQPLTH